MESDGLDARTALTVVDYRADMGCRGSIDEVEKNGVPANGLLSG